MSLYGGRGMYKKLAGRIADSPAMKAVCAKRIGRKASRMGDFEIILKRRSMERLYKKRD